jgi:hypothetical protein
MTSRLGPDAFALASTHLEKSKLTLAIIIGCSVKQMTRVESLLRGSEDAIRHPLLMLGICAELQLGRLRKLVIDEAMKCQITTRSLERCGETQTPNDAHKATNQEITWALINEVRANRDGIKRAGEEVRATKRQLYKALPPALVSLLNRHENNDTGNNNDNNDSLGNSGNTGSVVASVTESEPDEDEEITNMFYERFADIFAQFEGLMADCRINLEEMSFAADIVGQPLRFGNLRSEVTDRISDQE